MVRRETGFREEVMCAWMDWSPVRYGRFFFFFFDGKNGSLIVGVVS